jgi:carbamoyltransferase
MSQKFTGFSEWYHNAALAVINEDGVVEFASQAERFTKFKNDAVIPEELWEYSEKENHVSFYENHDNKWRTRRHTKDTDSHKTMMSRAKTERHALQMQLEIPIDGALVYDASYNHHQSHCATAFYTRHWDDTSDTVQVAIDGAGEHETVVIYDNKFNRLKTVDWPKSVGIVYSSVTGFLGLRPLEDEYVTMGLSSYGSPNDDMVQWLYDWYHSMPDESEELKNGSFVDVNGGLRHTKWCELNTKLKEYCDTLEKEVAAASCQEFTRRIILEIMTEARQYGSKLVYSGGCAQNVVINTLIRPMFDDVHIAIEPTDGGSALGAAALSWSKATGKDKLIWTPYCGYNIDREINPREVVDHLLKERVCGVANGRAEFGPRALGNRSLIADVRYDVKDTVNTIKRRQKYRPFAPAILEEFADQYFDGPMNEYMQYTSIARHDYSSVTHVDGTARVQVVKKDCESVFRKIIEEYYERTGVPMLLNTSLNIRGRPMVNDVHDARLFEQKYNVKVF